MRKILTLLALSAALQAQAASLEIEITGTHGDEGQVLVALFDRAEGWLTRPLQSRKITIWDERGHFVVVHRDRAQQTRFTVIGGVILAGAVLALVATSLPAMMPPGKSPALNAGMICVLMMTLEKASVRIGSRP